MLDDPLLKLAAHDLPVELDRAPEACGDAGPAADAQIAVDLRQAVHGDRVLRAAVGAGGAAVAQLAVDPRLLPEARRVAQISYDEMLELASAGAGVMHNRSIEFAKRFSVPVYVRSSLSDSPGTMITTEPESPDQAVCGAALVKDQAANEHNRGLVLFAAQSVDGPQAILDFNSRETRRGAVLRLEAKP